MELCHKLAHLCCINEAWQAGFSQATLPQNDWEVDRL